MRHSRHEPGHHPVQSRTEKGAMTEQVDCRHGDPSTRTPGRLRGRGRSYDMLAAVFFGGRRRRVVTRLVAESGARPGDRVLDVGCGTGYLTRAMAEAVAP